MKNCSKCKVEQSESNFWADKRRKGKLQAWCKSCRRNSMRKYVAAHPNYEKERYIREKDFHRQKHLKRKYGFSLQAYANLLSEQKGNCAICGCEAPKDKLLNVDHDHKTGMVRGLLCSNCNRFLGFAKENEEVLAAGIRYLRKSRKSSAKQS